MIKCRCLFTCIEQYDEVWFNTNYFHCCIVHTISKIKLRPIQSPFVSLKFRPSPDPLAVKPMAHGPAHPIANTGVHCFNRVLSRVYRQSKVKTKPYFETKKRISGSPTPKHCHFDPKRFQRLSGSTHPNVAKSQYNATWQRQARQRCRGYCGWSTRFIRRVENKHLIQI